MMWTYSHLPQYYDTSIYDLRWIILPTTTILGYSNICDLRGTTIFTTSTTILRYNEKCFKRY